MLRVLFAISVSLFVAHGAHAALKPLTMPVDCEVLLAERKMFLIEEAHLPEVAPILSEGFRRKQAVILFIHPRDRLTGGPNFTKDQIVELKTRLKKTGAEFYPRRVTI